jgi:hypothetical protein
MEAGDVYIVVDVGLHGCPHVFSACVEVWRETNGQPGLQRFGSDPDELVSSTC